MALVVLSALGLAQGGAPGPALRFHHLHYRVDDPAAAMSRAAITLEGERVLLQGLGVGVRAGDEYVLFERTASAPDDRPAGPAEEAYAAAIAWLRARGVHAPDHFAGGRLAAASRGEDLDHIAFVTADLDKVRAALQASGARPFSESDDAVMYRVDGGLAIEILTPTDLEDAFWCPMHPDVRSGTGGKCPLCGMDLTPIPAPRIGEYRMDVSVEPGPDGKGASSLRLVIRDPETGAPVESFTPVHERPLHLFIVGRALDYFDHLHPERVDQGTFHLAHGLPPGQYMLIADFLPRGGTSQTVQRAIVTAGYDGPILQPPPQLTPGPAEQVVDGLTIRLDAGEPVARRPAQLRFSVSDAATGAPVKDLERFLGAPAHLLIVTSDLTEAIHGHPEEQAVSAVITFEPLLPASGLYKLWVQVQRKGRTVTAPFVIRAHER